MKALCDICSGELIINAGGEFAVCERCSMKHSIQRVREKLSLNTDNEAQEVKNSAVNNSEVCDDKNSDNTLEVYEALFSEDKSEDENEVYDASFSCEDEEDEVFDASFTEEDEDDIAIYKAQYSDDDLYKLEGRDLGLGNDPRSFDELCDDIYTYLKSPIFSGYEVKRDVSASFYGAPDYAMDITFMLFKGGKEALAILVRKSLSKSHRVVKDTMDALTNSTIPFVDFVQTMPNTEFYIKRKIIKGLGL